MRVVQHFLQKLNREVHVEPREVGDGYLREARPRGRDREDDEGIPLQPVRTERPAARTESLDEEAAKVCATTGFRVQSPVRARSTGTRGVESTRPIFWA